MDNPWCFPPPVHAGTKLSDLGVQSVAKYEVMGGGRFYPGVSREVNYTPLLIYTPLPILQSKIYTVQKFAISL